MDLLEKIPNSPRITLYNYLLDLVSEKDGKNSSLYLSGVSHIIQEVWAEIIQNHWRTLNVRSFIPKKLGIHPMGFYAYKNGKKGISIQMLYKLISHWQNLCGKDDYSFKEKWNKVFETDFTFAATNGRNKVSLPKYISPKLSHLPIFNRSQKGWALQIGSKPIFRFLTKVLDIKVGKIPPVVEKFDKINKAFFLAGVFDAEGYVAKERPRITISQADKNFLIKLKKMFGEYNLKWNGPVHAQTKLGNWYFIHLDRKADYLSFVRKIGSYHIDKRKSLERQVKKIA